MTREQVRVRLWDEDGALTELFTQRRIPGGFECSMRMGYVIR